MIGCVLFGVLLWHCCAFHIHVTIFRKRKKGGKKNRSSELDEKWYANPWVRHFFKSLVLSCELVTKQQPNTYTAKAGNRHMHGR